MTAKDIVLAAVGRGQAALSEFESKKVLAEYGVPAAAEGLAGSADEAAVLAGDIGFPVAVKACSPDLMHKSDAGLVRLNLADEDAVRRAYDDVSARAGAGLDGILVSEMVKGNRELVVGLIRDPQFGPTVMLGLGGVMAEVLGDTVFRMAPLDRIEAGEMALELRSAALLGEFRGQKPADLEALCSVLMGVGRLGLELEEVAEVDVNPLIVDASGRIAAVDALVVLGKGGAA